MKEEPETHNSKEYGDRMIDVLLLRGLSWHSAVNYLMESGYQEQEPWYLDSDQCDVLVIYPYFLYDESGCAIDKIGHAEYCMQKPDGELDDFRSEWARL